MTLLLDGEVVLISGAAGGIGRASALAAAREGARLALADLDEDKLEQSAQAVRELGAEALCLLTDISDAAQIEAAMERTLSTWGRLDHAFNNAAISQTHCNAAGQTLGEIPLEAFNRIMLVNVTGTFMAMQSQIRQMLKQGRGTIVNMASITGLVGRPRSGAYAASKHAVIGLTRSAAMEYATEGLRINCVCPGFVDTAFLSSSRALRADQLINSTPMRRLGQPEEIAEAVIWLMSSRASFVTGAAISVDGGFTTG